MSSLVSKFNKRFSRSDESSSSSPSATQSHTRRREQVRRAQRTHRERRAKYLQGLEAEVMSLRAREAEIAAKLERAELKNYQLEAILQAHNIQLPIDLEHQNHDDFMLDSISSQPSDRVAPQWSERRIASSAATDELIDITEPQNAIDVILYLEQNCLDHIHQHRGEDNEKGHSLQLQMSIMETSAQATEPWSKSRVATWSSLSTSRSQLDAQLSRLLNTARVLDLQGELTPVMCWSQMKERLGRNPLPVQQLDQLLAALLLNMTCRGFGTVIEEENFYNAIDQLSLT